MTIIATQIDQQTLPTGLTANEYAFLNLLQNPTIFYFSGGNIW